MMESDSLSVLREALAKLDAGFASLPAASQWPYDAKKMERILLEVAEKLHNNFPYFHPLYAGQMLKPPHPVARAAYALAMWINPNNHALDGGRASSAMEKEAVAAIANMFGWKEPLGHLCGGGTMANLEALWVSGQLRPGATIVASSQAHYTHQRVSAVLGLKFESIPYDRFGRMDIPSLERRLANGDIGTVVATMGTTATGSVDPLPEILELKQRYKFRVHADAAYGGYFTLAVNLDAHARASFDYLPAVDSIVIDPHKHGLQPYGCGCVLFRDPSTGQLYKHDSPYTYFSSAELHLGEISLECSRPGASAVALWATQQLLPLERNGEFASMLRDCRSAALDLFKRLRADERVLTAFPPELDIVIWTINAPSVSQASAYARRVFDAAAKENLHLALAELPLEFFELNAMRRDRERITCLRSVLMKPEHAEWMDRIWAILNGAMESVLIENEQ